MKTPFPPLALAFASIALAGSAHAQTPKLDAMNSINTRTKMELVPDSLTSLGLKLNRPKT